MKKGINAWTVDGGTGFEEMFRQIKDAGFDGIELNVDEAGYSAHSLSLNTTESELAEIKKLSDRYQLPVTSISSSMFKGFLLGSPEEADRAFAKDIVRKQLACALALDAKGILVVPGGIPQQQSFAKAYDTSVQTLNELAPEVERAQINVGMENVWNGFFMSPFDMAGFIDRLNSRYFCAYYDVGNTVAFSWSEYWIGELGKRIRHVHVKDFKHGSTSFGGLNTGGKFVDILQGDTNWKAVIPALRKAGYDGYLTAEVFKEEKSKPFTDYYKEIADAIQEVINY